MKRRLVCAAACGLGALLAGAAAFPPGASAQAVWDQQPAGTAVSQAPADQPPAAGEASQAPVYPPQQLDQLLAPIALYPDPLLSQILMAATYPLEVVEAARWAQDPNNARLHGDQLDAALQQQDWDPSVKSLVPFPQILRMMNDKLQWTEALGNAFLAQQAEVMDSVQRLRAEAQAAGTLRSTAQETVATQDGAIVIEPASPRVVYVPYYDPRAVYGSWAYPDYPPYYFPPPPDYGYVAGPGIFFGIGFGIVDVLWDWDRWDWRRHDIHIDPDRFNRINNFAITRYNRPRFTATTWQHDPGHRRGVPYSAPAVRQRFQPSASAGVAARRDFRGFDNRGVPVVGANRGAAPSSVPRAASPERPGPGQLPALRQAPAPGGQRAAEAERSRQTRIPAAPTPQTAGRAVTAPPIQRAPVAPAPPPVAHAPPPVAHAPPPVAHAAPPPRQLAAPAPQATVRPPVQRPAAPAFSDFGRGADVRAQAQRGQASRQSAVPATAPREAAPSPRAAPREAAPAPRAAAPAPRAAPPRAAAPAQPPPPAGGQKEGGNDKKHS